MTKKIISIVLFSFMMGNDFHNPDGKTFTLSITTNLYSMYDVTYGMDNITNDIFTIKLKLPISKFFTFSYDMRKNNTSKYIQYGVTTHIPIYKLWDK